MKKDKRQTLDCIHFDFAILYDKTGAIIDSDREIAVYTTKDEAAYVVIDTVNTDGGHDGFISTSFDDVSEYIENWRKRLNSQQRYQDFYLTFPNNISSDKQYDNDDEIEFEEDQL